MTIIPKNATPLPDKSRFWLLIILCIVDICLSTGFLISFITEPKHITYEDTIHVTYTFEKAVFYAGKNRRCEIYIAETNQPLLIEGNLVKVIDRSALSSFTKGERIECYMLEANRKYAYTSDIYKKYVYKIVEVSQGQIQALSLEDANQAYNENRIGSFVMLPIMLALCVGLMTYGIINLIKLKQKKKILSKVDV